MRIPRLFALGLALSLLLAATQAFAGIECRRTALYDTNTNGSTVMITAQSTRSTFICGYQIFGGGTATVTLVYGTGVTCGTGETKLTPGYAIIAQAGVSDPSPIWRGMTAPAGQDVCIKTSAGVAINAIIYYVQQQ